MVHHICCEDLIVCRDIEAIRGGWENEEDTWTDGGMDRDDDEEEEEEEEERMIERERPSLKIPSIAPNGRSRAHV